MDFSPFEHCVFRTLNPGSKTSRNYKRGYHEGNIMDHNQNYYECEFPGEFHSGPYYAASISGNILSACKNIKETKSDDGVHKSTHLNDIDSGANSEILASVQTSHSAEEMMSAD